MDYLVFGLKDLVYGPDKRPRYDMRRFFASREGTFDLNNAYLLEALPTLPIAGTYQIVDDPFRPDMISHAIYGDTQYWWLLMNYNKVIDFKELTLQRVLNFFDLADLDRLFFSLTQKQLPSGPRVG